MSVVTRNPFALLNDEDVEPAPSAPSAKPVAPEPKAAPKDQKARTGPASRGGRYYQRGGAAKNVAKESQDNEAEPAPRERKPEGDVRGRGRGRGGRGGRGGGAGGRGRQYDRHSGTLPDSDKKVSQGWGANEGTAELNAEVQGNADAAKDVTTENWGVDTAAVDNTWGATDATTGDAWGGATAAEGNAETKEASADATPAAETRRSNFREEEEDNSLTLDEYLAQRARNEAVAVPKLETVRKANEGADESLWKDSVQLSKAKEEDNYFVGKTKATPKARAKKEEKVHIEIDARFPSPARGGGARGRGGRGGDRGGDRGSRGGARGRGAPRDAPRGKASGAQRDVDVDDQSAFPSLA